MTVAVSEEFDEEYSVMEAVQAGDRFAFEELVRRHQGWVRGVVFGVLGQGDRVEDITQQVWLSVWQQAKELRDVRRWRPWLYRLARNAAIDAGRVATRQRNRTQMMAEAQVARRADSPLDGTVSDEQHRKVIDAIEGLPALYREPFVLRHLNGWSYQQIAELMSMPTETVETRLVRARRLLRERLRDCLG